MAAWKAPFGRPMARTLIVAFVGALSCGGPLGAEEPVAPLLPGGVEPAAEAPASVATEQAPAAVVEAARQDTSAATVPTGLPDVWYLPDAGGRLRPVLGFTLEDFRRALELARGARLPSEPRGVIVESLSIVGRAQGELAELRVELDLVQAQAERWVAAPLALEELVLRNPPAYAGEGSCLLAGTAPGSREAWLRGSTAPIKHHLVLEGWTRLVRGPAGQSLSLRVPPATRSRLELEIGEADVEVESVGSGILEPLPATTGATRATVTGLGPLCQLSWRPRRAAESASEPADVRSDHLFELAGSRVVVEAEFQWSEERPPTRRFLVEVPPGARWIERPTSGYRVTLAGASEPGPPSDPPAEGQRLWVEFDPAAPREAPLTLAAEWTFTDEEDAATSRRRTLAPLRVVGVGRQFGRWALSVDRGWEVRAVPGAGLSPLDLTLLPARWQRPEVELAFEYGALPATMEVELAPRPTFVAAEPRYRLEIARDTCELTARLAYRIRGARLEALALELPDWQLVAARPAELFGEGSLAADEAGGWRLPLAEPAAGDLRVELVWRRPTPQAGQVLDVRLPTLSAETVAPPVLEIAARPNVAVLPRGGELVGLEPLDPAGQEAEAGAPRPQFAYQAPGGVGRFVADVVHREQAIAVAVESEVRLGVETIQVRQQFRYRVDHEPLAALDWECPSGLEPTVTLRGGGPSTTWSPSQPDTPARRSLVLPEPRLGPIEVELNFVLPTPVVDADTSVPKRIPLVVPAAGTLSEHVLAVQVAEGLAVELAPQALWKPVAGAEANEAPDALRLTATESPPEVALLLSRDSLPLAGAVRLEAQWIQTRLGPTSREERVVFRLRSREPRVEVRLGEGVVAGEIEAWLDGQPLAVRLAENNRLWLAWPGDAPAESHVLDLRYRFREPRTPWLPGTPNLVAAKLAAATWCRQTYWQVVTPATCFVGLDPPGYASEFTWDWQRFYWGRRPRWEQPQLERWVGALPLQGPAAGTHRYLYSTSGAPRGLPLRIVSRTTLVLATSGITLAVGLLALYLPWVRGPGCLLTVAVALGAGALIYPEISLVVAQAGALGGLLAALAGWLRARERWPARVGGASTATFSPDRSSRRRVAAAVGSARRVELATVVLPPPPSEPAP